jgi:serine-type D-Ala-D-Ala carboxypeptidase/endopeptidase (penicillin-binding protein 4)
VRSPWGAGVAGVTVATLVLTAAPSLGADALPPAPAPSVLPAAPTVAVRPTPQGVQEAIGPLVRRGLARGSVIVVDPVNGEVLLDSRGTRPRIPASTTKLATATAALDVLGSQTRLPTVVYRDDRVVTLVGGGDPTLTRADLAKLAGLVADDFGTQTVVTVRYDASAFTGPTLGPGWPTSFPRMGVVAPVTALMVDQGRVSPGASSRVADPARQAGTLFADLLRAEGLKVRRVRAGTPDAAAAREVARVESAPVADIVQQTLTDSDNTAAEVLAHLVGGALVGEASFAGGARATEQALESAGIDIAGVDLADGSGLSRRNRIPASALADILTTAVTTPDPDLSLLPQGLAVAGLTGTLADRFTSAATRPGRGFVQAKTGTLTGVSSLAGTVRDAEGRTLVFAMIDDRARSLNQVRATMDTVASRLATCGCD